jgi:hypothetical protein
LRIQQRLRRHQARLPNPSEGQLLAGDNRDQESDKQRQHDVGRDDLAPNTEVTP